MWQDLVDNEGKMRLEYIIDIGEGKGTFPPTPSATEVSMNNGNESLMMAWDMPEEAVEYATMSLKKYLLTMNDQEAECKPLLFDLNHLIELAKSLVSKWELE